MCTATQAGLARTSLCHLTDPSSPAWSRTRECTALGTQQVAAPSPVQRRVGPPIIDVPFPRGTNVGLGARDLLRPELPRTPAGTPLLVLGSWRSDGRVASIPRPTE